jgi:hypothetical protein
MSLPIFLPARRNFYFSHRLLLLFALKKIAETSYSGAERNQKGIRKESETNDSDKERNSNNDWLLGIYDSVSSLIHRAHFFGLLNVAWCCVFADQSISCVGCLARH